MIDKLKEFPFNCLNLSYSPTFYQFSMVHFQFDVVFKTHNKHRVLPLKQSHLQEVHKVSNLIVCFFFPFSFLLPVTGNGDGEFWQFSIIDFEWNSCNREPFPQINFIDIN